MGLTADLGAGPVAIDTPIIIYFIELHPQFLSIIEPLFVEADQGQRTLVTSALTLLEVLLVPYRNHDAKVVARYEALLTRSQGIRLIDVSREQLHAAAQLRSSTRLKTPDALQIAAAKTSNCRTFVTNDRKLPEIEDLRIVQLSSYL